MARYDMEKILKHDDGEEDDLSAEELLVYNLVRGQMHAQQALDICYKTDGCKRSLWFKMLLGRAQSILMSLTVRELGKGFGKE